MKDILIHARDFEIRTPAAYSAYSSRRLLAQRSQAYTHALSPYISRLRLNPN